MPRVLLALLALFYFDLDEKRHFIHSSSPALHRPPTSNALQESRQTNTDKSHRQSASKESEGGRRQRDAPQKLKKREKGAWRQETLPGSIVDAKSSSSHPTEGDRSCWGEDSEFSLLRERGLLERERRETTSAGGVKEVTVKKRRTFRLVKQAIQSVTTSARSDRRSEESWATDTVVLLVERSALRWRGQEHELGGQRHSRCEPFQTHSRRGSGSLRRRWTCRRTADGQRSGQRWGGRYAEVRGVDERRR